MLVLPQLTHDYCMLINECMDMFKVMSLLELSGFGFTELGQKLRYGALKACIG